MRTNWLFLVLLLLVSGTAVAQQANTGSIATNDETLTELRNRAEHGEVEAEFLLGCRYSNGDGIPTNGPEAFKWWRKSAEDGYTNAYAIVATLYDQGNSFCGVSADQEKAAGWFIKGAELGNANAEYVAGDVYYDGVGVPQDFTAAFRWFSKAADQGNVSAQFRLGVMYYTGRGMPEDDVFAVKWFQKAANQGDANSENTLGLLYENGQGAPQDFVEDYMWYNLSAAQGNTNAAQNRQRLAVSMMPSQIAKAQDMSRDFKPDVGFVPEQTNSKLVDTPNTVGTGFFITTDGYLISNFRVVRNARHVRIATVNGLIPAEVVQTDPANDLALLKVKGRFPALSVVASRSAGLGDTVFTLGFPDPQLQGSSPKLAKGEIASLAGPEDDARYFQISAPVQPGNSGGALVNERGNVIAIVAAKLNAAAALEATGSLPENVNYAIKSSYLLSFLESVPAVDAKLKSPNLGDEKFSDAVKDAEKATVMVLVY